VILGARFLPRIPGLRRVPSPLLALLVATGVHVLWNFPGVATIGTAFGGIPRALPGISLPAITVADALHLIGPAFAIALLGAIESLLTAVVADGMAGTRHDPNQELVGQGIANLLTPLFAGFAATGAIARTATSIRNGATSPLAAVVHCLLLVLVVVVLAPLAAAIPLAALAAILFHVAWNMGDLPHFMRVLRRAPRSDKALLLITFMLTVFVDLVVAVNVGVVIAALLFMRRMSDSVQVTEHPAPAAPGASTGTGMPSDALVYSIDGPFFFGAAEKLVRTLERIPMGIRTIVLRLDSALGKEVRGEGLVGLTRGFLHAGASNVLASLWSVSDRATAELMARFYRGLFGDGLPAAEALRRAQRSMLGERRWRDPHNWAGFVLLGDWQATKTGERSETSDIGDKESPWQ
jgi:SulP family sulfate permease